MDHCLRFCLAANVKLHGTSPWHPTKSRLWQSLVGINVKLTARKLIVVLLLLLTAPCFAVAQERSITLRGRVVDANSGEAMANVRVVAKLTDRSTITGADGAFTLELPPGPQDLYITTVTYGLVKKSINVSDGTSSNIEIALNEDAAALTENVTISSGPFESTRTTSTFEQTLNKRELQATSSILLSESDSSGTSFTRSRQ